MFVTLVSKFLFSFLPCFSLSSLLPAWACSFRSACHGLVWSVISAFTETGFVVRQIIAQTAFEVKGLPIVTDSGPKTFGNSHRRLNG